MRAVYVSQMAEDEKNAFEVLYEEANEVVAELVLAAAEAANKFDSEAGVALQALVGVNPCLVDWSEDLSWAQERFTEDENLPDDHPAKQILDSLSLAQSSSNQFIPSIVEQWDYLGLPIEARCRLVGAYLVKLCELIRDAGVSSKICGLLLSGVPWQDVRAVAEKI